MFSNVSAQTVVSIFRANVFEEGYLSIRYHPTITFHPIMSSPPTTAHCISVRTVNPPSKSVDLKMETAMLAETLETHQHSMQCIPES
jgi:hypothetical protein